MKTLEIDMLDTELSVTSMECVVGERNSAGETTRVVAIERIYEHGQEVATSARACGYTTRTSDGFPWRPLPDDEARVFIAHAVAIGRLT